MTKKQQLIDFLEKGFCVEVNSNIGKYIFYPPNQNTIIDWLNKDFTITKIYRQPIKPFKVGDKVKISESIKKCDKEYSLNCDSIYHIQNVFNDICGLQYSLKELYSLVSHEYLIPVLDKRKQVGDECEVEVDGELRKVKIIK